MADEPIVPRLENLGAAAPEGDLATRSTGRLWAETGTVDERQCRLLEDQQRSRGADAAVARREQVRLRNLVREKDGALNAVEEDLFSTKARLSALEDDSRTKRSELAAVRQHIKAILGNEMEDTETEGDSEDLVEALKQHVALMERRAEEGGQSAASEYFRHLERLETELKARDGVITTLASERKDLERLLRHRRSEVDALQKTLANQKSNQVDVAGRINATRAAALRIESLEEENGVLRHVQEMKTKAIAELSTELSARGSLDSDAAEFQAQMRELDEKVGKEVKKRNALQRDLQRAYGEREAASAGPTPISEDDWKASRKTLQVHVRRLRDLKLAMNSEGKRRDSRLDVADQRLNAILRSFKSVAAIGGRIRDIVDSEGQGRAVPQFHASSVSGADFDILERDVRSARNRLAVKGQKLMQMDDDLEALGRRADILERAVQSDAVRARRAEADMSSEIDRLGATIMRRAEEHEEEDRRVMATLRRSQRRTLKALESRG